VRNWPVVTYALIAANIWVFLYEQALGFELEAFVRSWGFVPARYFLLAEVDPSDWTGRYLPLLTSMFLHGGWAHVIGDMVYLWIFGDAVEDRLGHLRYLAFYLLTGVGAGLAHAYMYPGSMRSKHGAASAGRWPTRSASTRTRWWVPS
jgi:membrane associated rhomboid family serine protease